jgi:hypothetical protein
MRSGPADGERDPFETVEPHFQVQIELLETVERERSRPNRYDPALAVP